MDYNIKLWRQYREDNPGINAFLDENDMKRVYYHGKVWRHYTKVNPGIKGVDFRDCGKVAGYLCHLRCGCIGRYHQEYRPIYQHLITNLHLTEKLIFTCGFIFCDSVGILGDIYSHHGQTLAIYSDDGGKVEYHDIVHLIINLAGFVPETYYIFNCLHNLVSSGASFDTLLNGQYPYDRLTAYQHVDLRPFRPSWSINNHHYYADDVIAQQTILTVIMCCRYRTLLPIEIVEIILRYVLIKNGE